LPREYVVQEYLVHFVIALRAGIAEHGEAVVAGGGLLTVESTTPPVAMPPEPGW
jgi:hypothetical protein